VSCVKLRTRCDQENPCARCQELGKECVRGILYLEALGPIILTVAANTSQLHGARQPNIPRPRSRDAIPISHLLNSSPDDFTGRFPIRNSPNYPVDEDGDSALVNPESPSEASHWSEDMEPYDPYVGASDFTFDGFFDSLETLTFGHSVIRSDVLPPSAGIVSVTTDAISPALEPRALEVRQALSKTAGNFGNTLPEAQEMLQLGPAIEQVTGADIDSLVSLYFENYHRHCPILHRPSFQATLCPLALLLSVMALGGMYAPETERVQRMRSLLDVIEAYIFSLPGLRDEYSHSLNLAEAPDEQTLQFQFELFQGAYLIIIAQYFSGNVAAKRRARRQRFTRVLDVRSDRSLFVTRTDDDRLPAHSSSQPLSIRLSYRFPIQPPSKHGCKPKRAFGRLILCTLSILLWPSSKMSRQE
jgi:Fungal specific transcription factor domain/Fungal Zn(2)-Cys(6) binuclear cluster domain